MSEEQSTAREDRRHKKRKDKATRKAIAERAFNDHIVAEMLKDGKIYKGNDPRFELEWISTGIPDLDNILGGGMPRRRISILVGEYSSSKTFLVQMLMKQAITQGLSVAYIDTERSYDPEWWAQVGIPLDKIYVSQPSHGEAAVDVVIALARANVDVISIDSLAALVPMEETKEEAKAEQKSVALQARLIGKLMRMLVSTDTNSALVMTNQVRETIGGPMPGISMPGGKAPKHFSSIILRLRREGWIDDRKDRHVGFNIRVQCQKNKVSRPFGECLLPFHFRGEIDLIALLVDRAVEAGLIEQKGPWFQLMVGDVEQPVQQGRNKMIELLKEREDVRSHLERALGDG